MIHFKRFPHEFKILVSTRSRNGFDYSVSLHTNNRVTHNGLVTVLDHQLINLQNFQYQSQNN